MFPQFYLMLNWGKDGPPVCAKQCQKCFGNVLFDMAEDWRIPEYVTPYNNLVSKWTLKSMLYNLMAMTKLQPQMKTADVQLNFDGP